MVGASAANAPVLLYVVVLPQVWLNISTLQLYYVPLRFDIVIDLM